MGIIIKKNRHFLTRFPFWLALIVVGSLSPAIIGLLGAWVTERVTGEPCHEGNCFWMGLPWLTLMTAPLGAIALVVYIVIVLMDTAALIRENRKHPATKDHENKK